MAVDFSFLRNQWFQWGVLLLTLVFYIITRNVIFGILVAFEIFFLVAWEIKEGVSKNGPVQELKDTVIAILFAVGIWYGASFLLNTPSPISAVASCSMLPNLERGDFVIAQGVSHYNSHSVEMSGEELKQLARPNAEIVINEDNPIKLQGILSLYAFCYQPGENEMMKLKAIPLCANFSKNPEKFIERRGNLTINYGTCALKSNESYTRMKEQYPCVKSVEWKGKTMIQQMNNDIIVYQPQPGDPFARIGDIVHRAYFQAVVNGKTYYFTKGDNNVILDIQMGNLPVPSENVKGKVIQRIPVIGYFKLLISGFFEEPVQCRMILI